jgi:hypothetical protein
LAGTRRFVVKRESGSMTEETLAASFPIENRASLTANDFAHFASAVASQSSIKHALDWLLGHNPPLTPTGMVTQDEFSHDILVNYPGGLWLVYSTT